MDKNELSVRLAAGLGGWLQNLAAQQLDSLHGEDAARFQSIHILRAQSKWRVEISQRPEPWKKTAKERVDIALLPWQSNPKTWSGALEVKWPGEKTIDWPKIRAQIIQDIARLASIKTANLNARLLIIGGSQKVIEKLFEATPQNVTANSAINESARIAFGRLLPRETLNSEGVIKETELTSLFPDFSKRVPIDNFTVNALKVRLLGKSYALIGDDQHGAVYVWDCQKGQGAQSRP